MDERYFEFRIDLSTERLIGDNKRHCLKKNIQKDSNFHEMIKKDYNDILEQRGMNRPDLILSINGPDEYIDLTDEQKRTFIDGITQIGKNASTWIITEGFNCGVAKLVGEAGKDYRHLIRSKKRRFQLIGIGLLKKTQNKESINEYYADIGNYVKKISPYSIADNNKKDSANDTNYLNAYHDLFILCESEDDQHIAEKYRIQFESKVADLADCPLVQIIIQANQRNVENLDESIINRNSIISIKSSDEKTNLICTYLKKESKKTDQNIQTTLIVNEEIRNIEETKERKFNDVIFDMAYNFSDIKELTITHQNQSLSRKIMLCINYNEFQKLDDLLKMNATNQDGNEDNTTNQDGNEDIKERIKKFRDDTNEKMKKYNVQLVNSENIYENLIDFVLFRRLLEKKYDLVDNVWAYCSFPLITILICAWVCQRNFFLTKSYQLGLRKIFKKYEAKYLKMAEDLLRIAYNHNFDASQYLVIREIKLFQDYNCLEVAKTSKFYNFLFLDSCQAYLRKVWGDLPINMKKQIQHEKPAEDTTCKETIDAFVQKLEKDLEITEETSYFNEELKDLLISKIEKEYGFWMQYPSVKFTLYVISYLIHLVLYTYYVLVEFPPKQNFYIPYIAYAYSFGYIFDILNNVESLVKMKKYEISSKKSRVEKYFRSVWNRLDLFIYIIFIVGYIMTFQPSLIFYTRTIFAAYLSFLYLRFLQFYYAFKSIGQQIVIFGMLLNDVYVIILIYLLVLLSYGTLAQALLFPNTTLDLLLLKDIIYQPYWQLFGELNLEYVEGNRPLTNMNGTKIFPQKNAIVIVGFGVYMLLSNILLMNLLIAMFGISFGKLQDKKHEIWAQQYIRLISDFEHRTMFPPPLSCIEIIMRLFRCTSIKCRTTNCNEEEEKKKENLLKRLNDEIDLFERRCLEEYLNKNKKEFECSHYNFTVDNEDYDDD